MACWKIAYLYSSILVRWFSHWSIHLFGDFPASHVWLPGREQPGFGTHDMTHMNSCQPTMMKWHEDDMKMTCWVFFTLLILYNFLRFMPFYAFLWQWQLGSRDHRSSYVCGSARLTSGWRSFCWALLLWLWSCWSSIVPTSRPRLTAFSWAITSLEQQCNLIKLMVKLHINLRHLWNG